MQEIKPSLSKRDILCAETVAGPNAFVVFGASGDLAHRKLLVSIFRLYQQNLLDGRFYILGCGRKKFSDEDFRNKAEQSIRDSSNSSSFNELDDFTGRLYYLAGDYDDAGFYRRIKAKLVELDEKHDVLSVCPSLSVLYDSRSSWLGAVGLLRGSRDDGADKAGSRKTFRQGSSQCA